MDRQETLERALRVLSQNRHFVFGDKDQITVPEIIELLKAQEPRLMTLEEYDAWTDIPFTERDPIFHEERTERGSVTCWVNTTVCSLREYGKNDRCWTSRPTDEQKEATPWAQTNGL